MVQFINKHVVKIQLGVLASLVVTLLCFLNTTYSYVAQIDNNTKWIQENKMAISEISKLNEKVDGLYITLMEVKDDVKYLIRNK